MGNINLPCSEDDAGKAYEYLERRLVEEDFRREYQELLAEAARLLNVANEIRVSRELVASILTQLAVITYRAVRAAGGSVDEAIEEAERSMCVAYLLARRVFRESLEEGVIEEALGRNEPAKGESQ